MMQPSLEKLRKFFRLEHENGYSNSAIIGGLAKMLDYWEGEARADNVQEEVIQAVVQRLRSYDGLSPQSRSDALRGLWKRIGETYPEAQQKTRPAPHRRPEPIEARRPATQDRRPEGPSVARPVEVPHPETQGSSEGQTEAVEQTPRQSQHSAESEQPETQKQERYQRPVPAPRSEVTPGAKTSATPAALEAKLTVLQGIGPRHAETLSKLGMQTLGDMLYYYPRRYDDYSQLKPIKDLFYGEQVTVIGTIQTVNSRPIRGGKASIIELIISDGTAGLRLSFFNQPWLSNR